MHIQTISPTQTFALRSEVLRPGKDILACRFEGDDAPDSRHFGAFDKEHNIVGIVSVYLKGCPSIQGEDAYQLRAMATSPNYRGQGVGRLLLAAAEDYVTEKGASVIWANARSAAIGFYIKAGYRRVSDEFTIEDIGPHFRIVKSVDRARII